VRFELELAGAERNWQKEQSASVGTRLTLFWEEKPDRFFTVIKFWMDEGSSIALALVNSAPPTT
jgi:hypothetical protein